MVRRLLPLTLLFLAATEVSADARVPDVGARDLPVAGTCAPIDGREVTYVTVGAPGDSRVDGQPAVLDDAGLLALLQQRAAAAPGSVSNHQVWVVASAATPFLSVARVRMACQQARIYRMGLQVQPEQGGGVLGFPLFLPATAIEKAPAAGAAKARSLKIRLDRTEGPEESNPRRLYVAATQAVERFGPIVAEVSLDANLPTQHVVTCLDMLYRGGCAAVKLGIRAPTVGRRLYDGTAPAGTQVPTLLLATVQGRPLGVAEPTTTLPPIAPRKAPWEGDGANQPGALDMVLEDIHEKGAAAKEKIPESEPLPTYAGLKEGAPTTVVVAANQAVSGWCQALGKSLVEAMNGVATLPKFMVNRMREPVRLTAQVTPMQKLFKGTQRILPSTLKLDVYLVRGVIIVGKSEVTLHTASSALSFIFARWVSEQFPTDINLPPVQADPFAAGVPGHVRVWLEAAYGAAFRQGAAGLPQAPENEVLAHLPTVAHAGVAKALSARPPDFELLAKWLRVTEYDRLLIVPRQATAAVVVEGRIAGILQYTLEAEEKELRLTTLTGRAVPR